LILRPLLTVSTSTSTNTSTATGTASFSLSSGSTNYTSGGSYNFGSLAINTSTSVTFTIQNSGTGVLNLTGSSAVILSGTNSSEFSVTQPSSTQIASSSSISFIITYSPTIVSATTSSTKSASIAIQNNDPQNSSFTLNLSAIGTPEKFLFVTQSTYFGNALGGISGADAKCTSDKSTNFTNLPSGTYKAMLVLTSVRRACSTANCAGGISENIDWVFLPNKTYYLLNSGTYTPVITTNASGIFDFGSGTLANPFDTSSSKNWWTGLDNSNAWTINTNLCGSWNTSSLGASGKGSFTNIASIANAGALCSSNSYSVICVQQ
jgi:hypothetical protein